MEGIIGFRSIVCVLGIVSIFGCSAEICTDDVCEYDFDIAWGRSMTGYHEERSFPVEEDGRDLRVVESMYRKRADYPETIGRALSPEVVITADGVARDVITINNQFPGPVIQVMEGAEVAVRVLNRLLVHSTTVHWHGIHQKGTPFMDGAAFISQCPIPPGNSFTYRFKAEPAGTHWYHSHLANQKSDGLFGILIVHASMPQIPYFPVTITDWFHETSTSLATQNPVGLVGLSRMGTGQMFMKNPSNKMVNGRNVEITTLKMTSSLINGRGRFKNTSALYLTEFEVKSGERHRFRLVCAAQEVGFTVSVDQHKLDLVALDGQEIKTMRVDALMISPGESVDFVLLSNQSPGRYWMRTTAMQHGSDDMEGMVEHHQEGQMHHAMVESVRAIVSYVGSPTNVDPSSVPRVPTESDPYVTFGCPYREKTKDRHCIGLERAQSIKNNAEQFGLDTAETEIVEKFINVGFSYGSSINARQFVPPSRPPYGVVDLKEVTTACDNEDCKDGCQCTNIVELPLNKTVQLVISNIQPCASTVVHHAIHLHGHNFAVLAVRYDSDDVDDDADHHAMHAGSQEEHPPQGVKSIHSEEIKHDDEEHDSMVNCASSKTELDCDTPLCANPSWHGTRPDLNLNHPPIRDTVSVPAKGYVVIRFKTSNPGFWIIHCHNSMHLMEGMALLLMEGSMQEIPPLPFHFPTCSNFEFSSKDLDLHESRHSSRPHADQDTQVDNSNFKQNYNGSNNLVIPVSTVVVCSIALFIIGFLVACIPSICVSSIRRCLDGKKGWSSIRGTRRASL